MQEGKGCMAGIKEKLAYCITRNVITCIVYISALFLFPVFIFFFFTAPSQFDNFVFHPTGVQENV